MSNYATSRTAKKCCLQFVIRFFFDFYRTEQYASAATYSSSPPLSSSWAWPYTTTSTCSDARFPCRIIYRPAYFPPSRTISAINMKCDNEGERHRDRDSNEAAVMHIDWFAGWLVGNLGFCLHPHNFVFCPKQQHSTVELIIFGMSTVVSRTIISMPVFLLAPRK